MAAKIFEEDTLTQREYFEVMSKEGKRDFIFGGCCYDVETGDGKRVFTLRAARKCSLDEIDAIMHYMTVADKVDILNNEKDAISFNNLYKAMKEKTAKILNVSPNLISIKAQTNEKCGEIGREEAMMATCSLLLRKKNYE
jgi:2C-methyl-D-erythritol 2,4-cyclodiphosphate synthase